MESEDGVAAQQPQPAAAEQASESGSSGPSERTSQLQGRRTYAQVAASWACLRSGQELQLRPSHGLTSAVGGQCSQAGGVAQSLSRSAKKRRKRIARKKAARELAKEQPEAVQPCSHRAKDAEGDPGTQQPQESSMSTSQATIPNRSEAITGTEGAHGSVSSTQQPARGEEGGAGSQGTQSNVTLEQQERSQAGDGQRVQEVARILMKPGTSAYMATFPSIEEMRNSARIRASSRTSGSQTTHQGRHQKKTSSSADTAQQQDYAGSQRDIPSESSNPNEDSIETKTFGLHSKDQSSACGGGDKDDDDDGDDESSVESGSFSSSVDMNEVYDTNFNDIKRERDREEYIMLVVSNCAIMVSDMSGELTVAIRDIFGHPAGPADGAGPSRNGTSHSALQVFDIPEYDISHDQRLQRLKACVHRTKQPLGASEIVQEGEDSINEEEPATDSSEPSEGTTEVESGISSRGDTADSSRSRSPQEEQATHSSSHDDPTESEHEEVSHRRSVLLKSAFDIHAFAEIRAYKMRNSCKNLYSGLLCLTNIISLALEAYRGVQEVLEHVIRPPYAVTNGLVPMVTECVIGTSERLRRALCYAERAASIQSDFVRTHYELDKLLSMLAEHGPFTADVPDRYATLENVLSILQRSSTFINLDWINTKDTATGSTSAAPSDSEGAAAASAQLEGGSDERPTQGFETLLLATRTAVEAVEAAMMSLDVIYAAELNFRGEGQEAAAAAVAAVAAGGDYNNNEDDYDDDDDDDDDDHN